MSAALGLLAVFGSENEATRSWLNELRQAAEHNEKLVAEIDVRLRTAESLDCRERAVAEREASVADKIAMLQRVRVEFDAYQADVEAGRYG